MHKNTKTRPSAGHVRHEVCPEKVQPLLIQREQFAQHQCNLEAKESGLKYTCVNNDNFSVLVREAVDASEHVYFVDVTFKMTERVE